MDTLEDFIKKVEGMVVKMLIKGLRAGEVTEQQGRQYCKDFLALLPIASAQDAATKVTAFVQKNPYYVDLKPYVDTYLQEEKLEMVVKKMVHYLKDENNVDAALQVAKEAE